MTSELARAVSELQDSTTIHLAMKSGIKEGYAVRDEFLFYLDLRHSEDATHILKKENDTKVDFPVIAMDMEGKQLVGFMDPMISGKPISLHDWMWHWAIFAALQIDDDKDAALNSLVELICSWITKMDGKACLKALDRLWQYRWIYNAQTAGALRKIIIKEASSEKEMGVTNAVSAFEEYTENLVSLKEQVSNLDDWIEGLFLIMPHHWCAKDLNELTKDEDKAKRERFISEAFADTGAIFSTIVSKAKDCPELWTESFWPRDRPSPDSIKQIRRELFYRCSARIFYPRFFVNKSLEYFRQGGKGPIPAELNKFNYKHALSCFFSWLPESAVGHVIDWDQVRRGKGENS
jgi:hypothetical protein